MFDESSARSETNVRSWTSLPLAPLYPLQFSALSIATETTATALPDRAVPVDWRLMPAD